MGEGFLYSYLESNVIQQFPSFVHNVGRMDGNKGIIIGSPQLRKRAL